MRLFNNRNERLSTAVFLEDGSIFQVFPTKQVVESREAWTTLHPSWAELRNGQKTLFNTAEAEVPEAVESHADFVMRRTFFLRNMRTGGRPVRFATRFSPKLHPINGRYDGYSVEQLMEIHLANCDKEGTHWHTACQSMLNFVWCLEYKTPEEVITQLTEMLRWDLTVLKRDEYFRAHLNHLHAHFLALEEDNSRYPAFSKEICAKAIYLIVRMKKVRVRLC